MDKNSAFGILKEEPDDLKSFLKAYQSEVDFKGESIRVTITQALKELNDPKGIQSGEKKTICSTRGTELSIMIPSDSLALLPLPVQLPGVVAVVPDAVESPCD